MENFVFFFHKNYTLMDIDLSNSIRFGAAACSAYTAGSCCLASLWFCGFESNRGRLREAY